MDIISIIEFGTVTGVITTGLVIGGFILLKNRLKGEFIGLANRFVADLMNDALENPEKLAPFVKALTDMGMKQLGVTKEANGSPDLKIGGIKIPGWLAQAAMGYIQRSGTKAVEEGVKDALKSPFG